MTEIDFLSDDGEAEQLFLQELSTIERAIRFTCRRGGMSDDDADDFASCVKLKLIDNDYAIIRKYDRRSTFAAYISVVVQRLLLDYRIHLWGKWHASAEAKRLGEPAMTIEALIHRDGRPVDEVMPMLLRRWPELTRTRVEEILHRLPTRAQRPRDVELELASEEIGTTAEQILEDAFAHEREERARKVGAIVRATFARLCEDDRVILRLHFEGAMNVADIARLLSLPQKPLYRRVGRALRTLRKHLERAGFDLPEARALLSHRGIDFDFGFDGEKPPSRPSHHQLSSEGEEGE